MIKVAKEMQTITTAKEEKTFFMNLWAGAMAIAIARARNENNAHSSHWIQIDYYFYCIIFWLTYLAVVIVAHFSLIYFTISINYDPLKRAARHWSQHTHKTPYINAILFDSFTFCSLALYLISCVCVFFVAQSPATEKTRKKVAMS